MSEKPENHELIEEILLVALERGPDGITDERDLLIMESTRHSAYDPEYYKPSSLEAAGIIHGSEIFSRYFVEMGPKHRNRGAHYWVGHVVQFEALDGTELLIAFPAGSASADMSAKCRTRLQGLDHERLDCILDALKPRD